MLGNNEQIAGVSLPEVFSQMVSELPWKSLETYIQGNSQLLKLCTIGGTRLKPDKRKKFEQVIVREAEKQKFADITFTKVKGHSTNEGNNMADFLANHAMDEVEAGVLSNARQVCILKD